MEDTAELLLKFTEGIQTLNKEYALFCETAERKRREQRSGAEKKWNDTVMKMEQSLRTEVVENIQDYSELQKKLDESTSCTIEKQQGIYTRLKKCKECLSSIASAEETIDDREEYDKRKLEQEWKIHLTADELVSGEVDFISMALEVNTAVKKGRKRKIRLKSSYFYSMCRYAQELLKNEMIFLRKSIMDSRDEIHRQYDGAEEQTYQKMRDRWEFRKNQLDVFSEELYLQAAEAKKQFGDTVSEHKKDRQKKRKELTEAFYQRFLPEQLAGEYLEAYFQETVHDGCESENEILSVPVGTTETDISQFQLVGEIKDFLEQNYYFLFHENKLFLPCTEAFHSEFRYKDSERKAAVCDAYMLKERLEKMKSEKMKVNFFPSASFHKTGETKGLSGAEEIEDRLKWTVAHRRELKTPQIFIVMDFPCGFRKETLELLEKTAAEGSKYGIFIILYRNMEQEISEELSSLVFEIEKNLHTFVYSDEGRTILYKDGKSEERMFVWKMIPSSVTAKQIRGRRS